MIKNLLGKLYGKFGKDKVWHFGACAAITLLVGLMLFPFANIYVALFSAFMTASAAALAKEYGDKCSPVNHWDWKDVTADYLGVGLAMVILLILHVIIF